MAQITAMTPRERMVTRSCLVVLASSSSMVQPQYAQQIVQIADALFRSEWANCQLQQRLAQRQMAEEVYSNAGVCGDNCTTQLVRPTTC